MSEMPDTKTTYALEMKNVTKRFPGTLAVDEVTFTVKPGEVHALVGENGAGKSTLMKVLAGLYNDYTGDILIGGKVCKLHTPAMAKDHGVGMIYQELSLARCISIYENMLAGRLPKKNALFVDKKKAIEDARKLL
ncbi:MAG: ATP-binding cassette domain-containing protein, partial [Christensenella sp.]